MQTQTVRGFYDEVRAIVGDKTFINVKVSIDNKGSLSWDIYNTDFLNWISASTPKACIDLMKSKLGLPNLTDAKAE